ncbi:hypothetical protein HUT19_41670 (plasmid) [Streptomyces sp. NA02950]|uniref:hypothetical protein n=1 Tax=Streptomyces sp. NA02950 TaxID=2742137 RepID=UPI00159229B2|nr:hypothetical protein [Streptomyces sp. NA02950]QKV98231.1 hypothetical protein HUT19_41670 [Streptomyces sp. NA02950]
MTERPVENVDNRPTAIEPKQSDAVEDAHFRRRLRATMERPQTRPPLLTLEDVRALEDAPPPQRP